MKKKAHAKINLSLDVVEKLDNGYHRMEMVMVPIDLFDTVEIKLAPTTQLETNKGFLPLDRNNTIIKALELLRDKYNFEEQFSIKLQKNIPTQGGLGGGSSDAAIVIKMINEILELNMSLNDQMMLAEQVGADVPFCLYGRPAYVEGIGEKITPIDINLSFYIFIVKPSIGISTPESFRVLDLDEAKHPNTQKVIEALENNNYKEFIDNIGNSLEYSASKLAPEILEIKAELLDFGFDQAVMSGAGSTVFAVTQDEDLIDRAVDSFVSKYALVKKCRIIEDVAKVEKIRFPFK